MTQRLFFVSLLILATSCQFFETEKVTSEKIFQEEIGAIDWKEVDRYPSFSNCENTLEKPEQKDCFINTISTHLYKSINHEDIVAVREVYDTVKVNFDGYTFKEGIPQFRELDKTKHRFAATNCPCL